MCKGIFCGLGSVPISRETVASTADAAMLSRPRFMLDAADTPGRRANVFGAKASVWARGLLFWRIQALDRIGTYLRSFLLMTVIHGKKL